MSRFFYTLIFYLALPLVMLRLLYRAWRAPDYVKRWNERFGFFKLPAFEGKRIWVHTVSVGESIAAAPLVKKMLPTFPEHQFVITTMTPTGSEQVLNIYASEIAAGRVVHVYAPYDLPDAIARFLNKVQPELAVFMETELWPNTVAACHNRGIPSLLTNARLSERSAKGYARIGSLSRNMLSQLSFIAAQGSADAERFIELGFPKERLEITGTLKFDISAPTALLEQGKELREKWLHGRGEHARILIAASTYKGEDEQILDAYAHLRQSLTDVLLILVPRHKERFQPAYELIKSQDWKVARRSAGEVVNAETDILLGDTMGELMQLYATADVAFVGGSLIERGGHNPLEPAALGIPVIYGPHVFNFAAVNETLRDAGCLFTVHSSTGLTREAERLLTDQEAWQQASDAARAVMDRNRGALDRQLKLTASLLNR
ncbi:lipid IV(A) 3-deoxy-D-manno-octulosonic acid transferase [Parendozoicomonas haliclonae]|uniref:3-deoxy-D-manno-octulosonic acid transferase n=1 Tax=Parendozoicomonas haliclonae TaxID=1960125 RepID=A0A1X7AFX2_9GAMM|nr:lipid IV(A) 3-deoxy-D-manno-octulosonic acid transferase [Parendozoicomonas haliclonae]SMA37746.1 3-deoxy-D-manno-octulosonic acid transferase [Parendozoicomonas haliclonae]